MDYKKKYLKYKFKYIELSGGSLFNRAYLLLEGTNDTEIKKIRESEPGGRDDKIIFNRIIRMIDHKNFVLNDLDIKIINSIDSKTRRDKERYKNKDGTIDEVLNNFYKKNIMLYLENLITDKIMDDDIKSVKYKVFSIGDDFYNDLFNFIIKSRSNKQYILFDIKRYDVKYQNEILDRKNKIVFDAIIYFNEKIRTRNENNEQLFNTFTERKDLQVKFFLDSSEYLLNNYPERIGKSIVDELKSHKNNYKDIFRLKINDMEAEILGFNNGTFTAIICFRFYEKKYILRIYKRNGHDHDHLCDTIKYRIERELFNEYLISIYSYGRIKNRKHIKDINYEYNYYDFIITDLYNYYNKNLNTNLDNTQTDYKKLIISNIEMLNKLYEEGFIHTDYKMINIGWTNENTVILIDYDSTTLMKIDDIKFNNYPLCMLGCYTIITSTFFPEYLLTDKYKKLKILIKKDKKTVGEPLKTKMKENEIQDAFRMYSLGGLKNIISTIVLTSKIVILYTDHEKLDSSNEITYDEILIKFKLENSIP